MKVGVKLNATHPMIIFSVATLVFGSIGFLTHYSGPLNRLFLFEDYETLVLSMGGSDAGNYLRAGNSLARNELDGQYRWVFNLWPPGMAHVYALIISASLPIGLSMVVIGVGAYGLALTVLFKMLEKTSGKLVALFGLGLGVLNPFAVSSLGPANLLYSDGLGASFLVLALLSFTSWVPTLTSGIQNRQAGAYGLLFAVSSVMSVSFRWSMVPVIFFLWAFAMVFTFYRAIEATRNTPQAVFSSTLELRKGLLVTAISALPWTIYAGSILHPPNPLWSVGTDYQWAHRWQLDADLPGFLVAGNANWACDLDPQRCEELSPLVTQGVGDYSIFREAAISVVAENPLGFLSLGARDFFLGFFTAPFSGVGTFTSWQFSAISAGLLVGALAVASRRKNRAGYFGLLTVLLVTFLSIAMFHVESRYLLPLHYLAFTLGVYLVGASSSSSSGKKTHQNLS